MILKPQAVSLGPSKHNWNKFCHQIQKIASDLFLEPLDDLHTEITAGNNLKSLSLALYKPVTRFIANGSQHYIFAAALYGFLQTLGLETDYNFLDPRIPFKLHLFPYKTKLEEDLNKEFNQFTVEFSQLCKQIRAMESRKNAYEKTREFFSNKKEELLRICYSAIKANLNKAKDIKNEDIMETKLITSESVECAANGLGVTIVYFTEGECYKVKPTHTSFPEPLKVYLSIDYNDCTVFEKNCGSLPTEIGFEPALSEQFKCCKRSYYEISKILVKKIKEKANYIDKINNEQMKILSQHKEMEKEIKDIRENQHKSNIRKSSMTKKRSTQVKLISRINEILKHFFIKRDVEFPSEMSPTEIAKAYLLLAKSKFACSDYGISPADNAETIQHCDPSTPCKCCHRNDRDVIKTFPSKKYEVLLCHRCFYIDIWKRRNCDQTCYYPIVFDDVDLGNIINKLKNVEDLKKKLPLMEVANE